MVDRVIQLGVGILFVIGGDGTLRGAGEIAAVTRGRAIDLSVIDMGAAPPE